MIKVVIIGAGPAGLGIAALLNQTDITYVVLEKNEIGSSFSDWPEYMEMITPSFPSNAFGQMDLNSICERTSPAFSYNKEHPSGYEYAEYLSLVAGAFNLHVQSNTEVKRICQKEDGWLIDTNQGQLVCQYLIWAGGEYHNPKVDEIEGAEHCVHSSQIKHPEDLIEDEFVVVGGYESGVQLAIELVGNGKKVTLINPEEVDDMDTSDPSRVLSPYTYTKYRNIKNVDSYSEIVGKVTRVFKSGAHYALHLEDGTIITSPTLPICATGFGLVPIPFEGSITYREDGFPLLVEESDEFYGHKNFYLTGPSVRHDTHIFCFIYKFRQRFGVIVEDILKKERYHADEITFLVNKWKSNGMYLTDLSCCADECVC